MVVDAKKFNQLVRDVALMKDILVARYADSEGVITDWAKAELAEARQIPDSELLSSKDVKRMILAK